MCFNTIPVARYDEEPSYEEPVELDTFDPLADAPTMYDHMSDGFMDED